MSAAKTISVVGLSLTILGALVLAFRDLRRQRERSYNDVLHGFPRRETWIGFPLIALGSAAQIVGVVIAPRRAFAALGSSSRSSSCLRESLKRP